MNQRTLFFHSSSRMVYEKLDAKRGKMTIQPRPNQSASGQAVAPPPIVLIYQQPAPDELLLEGTFEDAELSVYLRRIHASDFRLMKHKFRWVGR